MKEYYSMSTLEKLDKVDLQILRTLQENARLTNLVKHYKAAMPSVREENIEAFANTLCSGVDKEKN